MAKKSKTPKKSRFGNPAKAAAATAATTNVVSFTDAVAKRALEPLLPGFTSWMGQAGVDAEEIQRLSHLLMNFFKNYAQSIPTPEANNLDVELTSRILDSAGGFHPEMRAAVSLALNSYLKFLLTTGSWLGTPAQLQQLITMTAPEAALAANSKYAQRVSRPLLTAGESAASAEELVFVHRATALLAWIGEGREVTTSGLLKRKDIQAAAACVDKNAVGSATRAATPGAGHDAPMPMTSMTQLPRLMDYWRALADAELIHVSRQRVTVTGLGRVFQSDPNERARYAVMLAYFLAYDVLVPYDDDNPKKPVRTEIAEILASAASSHPPETSTVLGKTPAGDRRDYTAVLVETEIRRLAAEGLVEIGSHLVVPPVLRHAVEQLLRILDEHIAKHSRGSRMPSKATYQLRVQIDGITPPVWRSVNVPAEFGLDELHETIQCLFAWNETHLHEFVIGTHPASVRYAPDNPELDHWGEPPLDEQGVPLDTLLGLALDTFSYSYDFGDDWQHTVSLTKILSAAGPGVLPQCVAGSGHPPQEDSAGPHGWMEKIAISQDPSDPEHRHIRDWLGLRKGQNIDPAAFDKALVNKRLAELRTVQ